MLDDQSIFLFPGPGENQAFADASEDFKMVNSSNI